MEGEIHDSLNIRCDFCVLSAVVFKRVPVQEKMEIKGLMMEGWRGGGGGMTGWEHRPDHC